MRGKNLIYPHTKKFGVGIYFWLIAFLLGLMLLHLYIFTKSVATKYEIADLKVKLKELKSRNRVIASKLANEESLPKIEKESSEKLKMYYPETVNYIVVSGEAKQ